MKPFLSMIFLLTVIIHLHSSGKVQAKEQDVYETRMELYKKVEAVTQIPWYYLAAIDQYERNIRAVRKDIPKSEGVTGIYFSPEKWCGVLNPDSNDENPLSILFFDGMGSDGNGDGKAKRNDDEDVLHTFADYITSYGVDHDHIKIALWNYYKRDKAVGIISGYARVYKHFNRLDLEGHAFPVPIRSNHTYKNTWGDPRGWGGRRMHEGTDIFANYGVPVRSTSYGVIEIMGWNRFGGWRIGIRDMNNNYHYFAHLTGFAKNLKIGQVVEPGMLIGGVGSSGYGPPGTAGKFPPHLHYGMYKDNGKIEWAYDPYPHLRMWERQERIKMKK